ncbi:MAG: methyltransferase domain-containing protein [Chloroflexota bacterium]
MTDPLNLRQTYHQVRDTRHWLSWPLVRHLRTMQFRRLRPFDDGRSSGLSVIRYYWADFLEHNRADIKGRALEIGETSTIRAFGGDAVTQPEALDLAAHSPEVKVVADLTRADQVPSNGYDCFVNQFTTTVIHDIEAALYHAIRILKPGGVLLINFWCLDFYLHRGLDMGTGAPLYMHHWFTPIQIENMLRGLALTEDDFDLSIYGNLLTRMAFLLNEPAKAFTAQERDTVDPGQPLLICARIVKPQDWQVSKPVYKDSPWIPDTPPAQLSEKTGHYGDEYD